MPETLPPERLNDICARADKLFADLPESVFSMVDGQTGRLDSAIDEWKTGDIGIPRAMGRVRNAAAMIRVETRRAVHTGLFLGLLMAECQNGDKPYAIDHGHARVQQEALSLLEGWILSMDNPEKVPSIEIHHVDIALLRAAITGKVEP